MPNLTNNEWAVIAGLAVLGFFAIRNGWLTRFAKKPAAPAAPAPAQPMVQAYMEPAVAPQTLDDQVLSAASVLKGVSAARRDLKDAYALVDAHDAAVLEIRAKEQARINAMAAKVEVK